MGKKSILLTIEGGDWNRFKSRVSLQGLSVASVVREFIISYCEGGDKLPASERAKEKKGSERERRVVRKKPTADPPASGEKESVEESVKGASSDFTPGDDDDDEGMIVTDRDLVEHASHFSIKVSGDEGALREKVLRAIEEEHGERGGDEEWIGANLGMLRWYNDNRG